jgi:hypothetical protein
LQQARQQSMPTRLKNEKLRREAFIYKQIKEKVI